MIYCISNSRLLDQDVAEVLYLISESYNFPFKHKCAFYIWHSFGDKRKAFSVEVKGIKLLQAETPGLL